MRAHTGRLQEGERPAGGLPACSSWRQCFLSYAPRPCVLRRELEPRGAKEETWALHGSGSEVRCQCGCGEPLSGPPAHPRHYYVSPGPVEPAGYYGDGRAGVPGSGESLCFLDPHVARTPRGGVSCSGHCSPRPGPQNLGRSWVGAPFLAASGMRVEGTSA